MSFEIEVNAGSSVKLPTAGKYCDRDIVVTATGGDGGYDEGYADGVAKVEESNAAILTDCNAVLPDKGVEPADTLAQVPQRIEEIQSYSDGYDVGLEDGKQAEYDRFWNAYQDNGNRTAYQFAFGGKGWTDETFKPKHPIAPTDSGYIFRESNITDLTKPGVVLDFSQSKSFSYAFAYSSIVKFPTIDMSNATSTSTVFGNVRAETLSVILSEKTPTDYMFINCENLTNLTIGGVIGKSIGFAQSSNLTTESVQSIIDHLKDLTGGTAQTLTLHSTVGAKLTDAQKATITAKNWTLVY